MSNTQSIAALRPEVWQKELKQDVIDGMYFTQNKMMGKDDNNVIQIKDELKKSQGDTITFGLTAKMSGAGVSGDADLEGQEEQITPYSQSIVIDQKRNAFRLTGLLDEQMNSFDMRKDGKEKLAMWMMEFEERQIFLKMAGIDSTDLQDVNSVTYSADATWSNSPPIVPVADEAAGVGSRYICTDSAGLDSLAATDIMTTNFITRARVKAQLANPKVVPLRIGGKQQYVMFMHPWQIADLKTAASSTWAQAQREAQTRGDGNNIFTGSAGVWDNVILQEHEYVPVCQSSSNYSTSGTAAGAQAFRSLLCGRQAIGFAQSKNSHRMVEKSFDYENKTGYSTGLIGGIQKISFNSLDYGVITVDSGATSLV